MEHYLAWAIVGLVLVITELLTGTFYLLMLGIAAFVAAAAAWLGFGFEVQAVVFLVASGVGCYAVHLYREKNRAQQKGTGRDFTPFAFATECCFPGGMAAKCGSIPTEEHPIK